MSGTPPLSHQLPRINKFVGEAFEEQALSRTIYTTTHKASRVILLIGPQTARKTSLIDFLCNYFYGAKLDEPTRYHIANEKFDSTTPEKQIITYVFNDAKMDFRPIVIDTPSTSGPHGEENRRILAKWLGDNDRMKIDAIGVVFPAFTRLTSDEEEGLQKALQLVPPHMRQKQIVFMTGSDGSSLPVGMLRRFNLDRADVYKVNTSCIFQRPEEDPLQEHLRGNYWRMSVANLEALFSRLKFEIPFSPSIRSENISPAVSVSLGGSSTSSQSSKDTVIRQIPVKTEVSITQGPAVLQTRISDVKSISGRTTSSGEFPEPPPHLMRKISSEETIKTTTTHSEDSTSVTHRLSGPKTMEQRSTLPSSTSGASDNGTETQKPHRRQCKFQNHSLISCYNERRGEGVQL
ncbi:hypothetical protein COOONC_23309 [Cooperia oncophora]